MSRYQPSSDDQPDCRGILPLKILGLKFGTLHRRIVLPSSSILASIKSTDVNEKLAQIIVPGNVKFSRIVSWPREHQGVVNIESFSTRAAAYERLCGGFASVCER